MQSGKGMIWPQYCQALSWAQLSHAETSNPRAISTSYPWAQKFPDQISDSLSTKDSRKFQEYQESESFNLSSES